MVLQASIGHYRTSAARDYWHCISTISPFSVLTKRARGERRIVPKAWAWYGSLEKARLRLSHVFYQDKGSLRTEKFKQ